MLNNEELVSPKEMKENIDLIKSQIPTFIGRFREVSKNKVEVSNYDISKIIKKSVEDGNLNEDQERIMNGFYESWMSIFMMVGSDKEALEILFRMIDSVE